MAFIKRKKIDQENSRPTGFDGIAGAHELIKFADKKGIETDPLDVSALTKLLGIKMSFEPMIGDDSGSLAKQRKTGIWVMKVNSLHHPNRQRFTIAHELGHFIKHRMKCDSFSDTVFFRNGESNIMEVEANKFAAELLMPEEKFRNFIEHVSNTVESIAEHFHVSSMAVRIRARELGYQGHNL